jgi:hypothetical protein
MQHPFINNLSEKSLEQLQKTISDLTQKLNFAYRTGNGPLIQQIQMAIESYRTEYGKKMDELMKKQNINSKVKIENERKNI